jgi:hypothetical protein
MILGRLRRGPLRLRLNGRTSRLRVR